MRRREFIALMGASIAWPFAALAQQPGRTYRLGGVSISPRSAPYFMAMFDELRRQGFIAGQNLTIEWRVVERKPIWFHNSWRSWSKLRTAP
jgi:putative ABC transport system substrate-binding protein